MPLAKTDVNDCDLARYPTVHCCAIDHSVTEPLRFGGFADAPPRFGRALSSCEPSEDLEKGDLVKFTLIHMVYYDGVGASSRVY